MKISPTKRDVFDFESLPNFSREAPSLKQFQARDGASLSYSFYDSQNKDRVIILLHGSSAHGEYLHVLAEYLSSKRDVGQVYVPNLRGHYMSGASPGDCSYIGQLEDDLVTKLEEQGWGLWAVSIPGVAEFIGFIGLAEPSFNAHFTPAIEVGWRLAYDFWGHGYATEGAIACLRYGFEKLSLNEIVSFTAIQNMRSRRIMEKIGLHHDPKDDFDHPKLSEDHWLKKHVLYRLKANEWKKWVSIS